MPRPSGYRKDGVVTLSGALETQVAIDYVKTLAADVEGAKRSMMRSH